MIFLVYCFIALKIFAQNNPSTYYVEYKSDAISIIKNNSVLNYSSFLILGDLFKNSRFKVDAQGRVIYLSPQGNEAVLYKQITKGHESLPLRVLESDCFSQTPKMTLHLAGVTYRLIFVWTKHRDATKIGQELKVKNPNYDGYEYTEVEASYYDLKRNSFLKDLIPFIAPTKYSVDPISSLKEYIVNGRIYLSEISAEDNTINRETSVSENQATRSILDVEAQVGGNNVIILRYHEGTSTNENASSLNIPLSDSVGGITIRNGSKICDLSYSIDYEGGNSKETTVKEMLTFKSLGEFEKFMRKFMDERERQEPSLKQFSLKGPVPSHLLLLSDFNMLYFDYEGVDEEFTGGYNFSSVKILKDFL